MHYPSLELGSAISDLETPSLIVDLDALDRNIDKMANFAKCTGVHVRPHAKSHRCPEIAKRQIAAGAVGQCAQTVGEAEALVKAGVHDILVTNQIVSESKLRRLAFLCLQARISLCFDNLFQIDLANRVAKEFGVIFNGLVEIDVGMKRCGVCSAGELLTLAQCIRNCESLDFGGIQAYQGRAQHIVNYIERRAAITSAIQIVEHARDVLLKNNIPCQTVTGAGTGTYEFEARSGVYTEIQVGSYIFMDRDYGRIRDVCDNEFRDFENSLFILATIISNPRSGEVIADAGIKSYSLEKGFPAIFGDNYSIITSSSDEHSVVSMPVSDTYVIGKKLRLIPSHCDPTVNLHDYLVGFRNDVFVELLPISARGASS